MMIGIVGLIAVLSAPFSNVVGDPTTPDQRTFRLVTVCTDASPACSLGVDVSPPVREIECRTLAVQGSGPHQTAICAAIPPYVRPPIRVAPDR